MVQDVREREGVEGQAWQMEGGAAQAPVHAGRGFDGLEAWTGASVI
jgi:hypothetical protein